MGIRRVPGWHWDDTICVDEHWLYAHGRVVAIVCGADGDWKIRCPVTFPVQRLVYGESLRQICRDEAMHGRRTVFQWLEKHPEFVRLYAAAREAQIDHLLGENVEIADTDPIVERARLRINARLAWIAKLHARKY